MDSEPKETPESQSVKGQQKHDHLEGLERE